MTIIKNLADEIHDFFFHVIIPSYRSGKNLEQASEILTVLNGCETFITPTTSAFFTYSIDGNLKHWICEEIHPVDNKSVLLIGTDKDKDRKEFIGFVIEKLKNLPQDELEKLYFLLC